MLIKIQFLASVSDSALTKMKAELECFCRHLDLPVLQHIFHKSQMYVFLPKNELLKAESINAVSAWCHLREVSARLATDTESQPFLEDSLETLYNRKGVPPGHKPRI